MNDRNRTGQPLEAPDNCLNHGCAYWPQCRGCGFDREEAQRRLWALKKFQLQRMKNGLYGLKLRRAKK